MDRVSVIEKQLSQHLLDVRAQPRILTKSDWANIEHTDLRTAMGVVPPSPKHREAKICPELIAEQTKDLPEDRFRVYLDAIEWVIDRDIKYHYLAPADRIAAVEEELAELAPGSLRVLTEVAMRWLDRQTDG